MSKFGSFLAGFALAAAASGAWWWFVARPKWDEHEARSETADRVAQRAKRDAADYRQTAERERARRAEIEEELVSLKKTMSAAPPKPPMTDHVPPAAPANAALAPALWDGKKLREEVMVLAQTPHRLVGNPRFALVVQALKAHGDESLGLLTEVLASNLDNDMKYVCATLLGALGDARGVKPLLAFREKATDEDLRRAALRGLANLPGDEQTPILVAAWNDDAGGPFTRAIAVHGLARRRHEIALAVAAGGAPLSTPPLRIQAMNTLYAQAFQSDWKDASLLPVFDKALNTADGDAQQQLALKTIEAYWSKDSLADLDTFAASSARAELTARAKKYAEDIRDGKPRPEGAGAPPPKAEQESPDIASPPTPKSPQNPPEPTKDPGK